MLWDASKDSRACSMHFFYFLNLISEEQTCDYFPNLKCASSSLDDNSSEKEPIQESLETHKATNVYNELLS